MANSERFNELAPVIREARSIFPERFAGKTDQQVINEIAAVVRKGKYNGRYTMNETINTTQQQTADATPAGCWPVR